MDTASSIAPAIPARGRTGPLLALALAATTAFSLLAPATAAAPGPVVHVVVTAAQDGAAGVASAVRAVLAAGGAVDTELPLVGGVSATLPAGAVLPPSYVVAEDRPMHLAGASADGGANSTVRATLGLGAPAGEGRGVTVAVVDTGVAEVPDLAGRVTHVNVTGEGSGDQYGHGTFVAGLVAGDGSSSDGLYAGVAPAAEILDVRVARADGSTSLSLVLAGLQEVARRPQVDVVNLSLSSGSPLPYQLDPLTQALERLWERGVVVVVPSGNDGPGPATVTSPGVDPMLLTVGGLADGGTSARGDDTVASWSGQGPAPQGVAKPDLVAPGQSVVSLLAPGSVVHESNGGSVVEGGYFRGSGTSFSTALTAGAAAVLLDSRELSPDQVKTLLTSTAYTVAGDGAGAGGLDAAAADVAQRPAADRRQTPSHPGLPQQWDALVQAFFDGDQTAAANSWSALPPAAKQWAARNWTTLSLEARNWTANSWSELLTARNWTEGSGGTADEWQMRLWAAQEWAARNWTARNWTARNWTAEDWAARNWTARNWTESDWAARNWTRNWTARNWTARNWTAEDWTARNWTARNWTAHNWTARNWSAIDWVS